MPAQGVPIAENGGSRPATLNKGEKELITRERIWEQSRKSSLQDEKVELGREQLAKSGGDVIGDGTRARKRREYLGKKQLNIGASWAGTEKGKAM